MMTEKKYRLHISCIILIVMIFSIYSNTFHSPWILDDFHNVADNPLIQIRTLSLENITGSFFSSVSYPEKLYRPVACLTFALNALTGGQNVTGYHFVNILIHTITSLLVMWLIFWVFRTPALEKTDEKEKHFVIILSAFLWAVNPVQIQAVTYIVQRMTSLCTLFAIMSLGFYIKARLSDVNRLRIIYYGWCITGIILSVFSKENGIITIPLIFCLEFFLFRNGDYRILTKKSSIIALIIFILIAACFFFYISGFSFLDEAYQKRSFTRNERILTQARALIYYLSLIFYPLPQRFSIEHEIAISTGLFSPVTTFLCIVMILSSVYACIFIRKIPIMTRLGIVFYFLAHSIESSILPLELVFEHRNYLPSVFLFPPIASGLYQIISYYEHRKKIMQILVAFFISVLVILTGLATYTRNLDWSSAERLWLDAMKKAPGHARPKHSLAFAIGKKNPVMEIELYKQALKGYMHLPALNRSQIFNNMGFTYLSLGDHDNAVMSFTESIKADSSSESPYRGLAKTYIIKNQWDKAIKVLTGQNVPVHPRLMALNAVCFLYTGNYSESARILRILLKNDYEEKATLINLAETLSLSGYHDRAELFLRICHLKYPKEPMFYISIAKNCYMRGDKEKASRYLMIFFKLQGAENAGEYIKRLTNNIVTPIIGLDKMKDFISDEFEKYKKSIRIMG